jgi:signal transduction histidine kinase
MSANDKKISSKTPAQLFSGFSHELRTPLTLILGSLENLRSSQNLSPEQLHDIAVIESNARILLKYMNDLMDVTKSGAHKTIEQHEDINFQSDEILKTTRKIEPSMTTESDSEKPLVLVLEDNVDLNYLTCKMLSDTYRTESAFDGVEGLQKAAQLHPDVIISDIMMPGMNGIQFTHEMRQRADLLKIPIMILTAKADDELCIKMLHEGAQDFMLKPFSFGELKARLKNLILTRKAEDELDRFVYLASHDLKSPLPAIKHLISWIEEDTGEQLSESSKNHITLLRRRADRMMELLDGLLKYSQADQIIEEASMTNSKKLIEDICHKVNPANAFSIQYLSDFPTFKTYKNALYQVLFNLLDNSIKHHHQRQGTIEISARELDAFYEFSIKDDGPGINPIYHKRIFQLFQTLQPRDKLETSGVGLSLAKKIIESLGGKITIKSAENAGSTFSFTWPK